MLFSDHVSPVVRRLSGPTSRLGVAAAASLTVLALAAPAGALAAAHSAQQSPPSDCGPAVVSQPFATWGDSSDYMLAPGGDFESGAAGWTLTGGAGVVPGSESFDETGSPGRSSLRLNAGASATSPPICVTAEYPTLRLFARGLTLGSTVLVQVVYDGGLFANQTIPVGAIVGGSNWAPSPILSTLAEVDTALTGGATHVSLRFTELTGSSQLDDVFVDPRLTY
jgi:hypothetical protein